MTFILANQRRTLESAAASFERYRHYLKENRSRFPSAAYDLATAPWYYDPHDHRCPHDAWFDSVLIGESGAGEHNENRTVTIRVRLLGAYHDGHIQLVYPRVFHYDLALADAAKGHRDWRYDEFRLSEAGRLVHEIEWSGAQDVGRWLIEASDVTYAWLPNERRKGSHLTSA